MGSKSQRNLDIVCIGRVELGSWEGGTDRQREGWMEEREGWMGRWRDRWTGGGRQGGRQGGGENEPIVHRFSHVTILTLLQESVW